MQHQIKPLKPFGKNSSENSTTGVFSTIYDWFIRTRFYEWCTIHRERVGRSLAYARFGWSNYDFDGAYALELLAFKLRRIQNSLLNHGSAYQDKQTVQSLRLVIRLLDRLVKDEYSKHYDKHGKKWGHSEFIADTDEQSSTYGRTVLKYPHPVTPEQDEQRTQELRAAFDADDQTRTRDSRLCFSIMSKYLPYWWD